MPLFAACNSDIEEFRFTGHVVGARLCSSTQLGYVIDLLDTEDMGVEFTANSLTYKHAVIGYKSPQRLMEDDTVTGVAYLTKSYAALNCFGIIEEELPEIIILSID
ncbi:MAG: hypothetical protein IJM88_02225 [Bacteroidales bacterium]|nr:hypothetical protein [Bacteroidales bacterium]